METLKSKYTKMRNAQKLDNTFLWEYYKENGGKISSPQEFIESFYFIETPIEVNGQLLGFQKTSRDLSSFFSDMDKKFGLTTLWDKEGSFLKVVE